MAFDLQLGKDIGICQDNLKREGMSLLLVSVLALLSLASVGKMEGRWRENSWWEIGWKNPKGGLGSWTLDSVQELLRADASWDPLVNSSWKSYCVLSPKCVPGMNIYCLILMEPWKVVAILPFYRRGNGDMKHLFRFPTITELLSLGTQAMGLPT